MLRQLQQRSVKEQHEDDTAVLLLWIMKGWAQWAIFFWLDSLLGVCFDIVSWKSCSS